MVQVRWHRLEIDRRSEDAHDLVVKLRRYWEWGRLLPKDAAKHTVDLVRSRPDGIGDVDHEQRLWRRVYPPTGREGLVPVAFVLVRVTHLRRQPCPSHGRRRHDGDPEPCHPLNHGTPQERICRRHRLWKFEGHPAARSEYMAAKADPAKLARQARDLIEDDNRVLLDDANALSAPALSEATQALKSLVDRLPQAFEQTGDVLEMLASQDRITMEQGDPRSEAATTAAELRAVAADTEQLAKDLSHPASALFLMGGR
jgi:hypothetical protein